MQMRARRYIRFDFAQASHTRATCTESHDYRIIARTWASDHSSTRALAWRRSLRSQRADVSRAKLPCSARQEFARARFAHGLLASPRIAVARAGAIRQARETRLMHECEHSKRRSRPRRAYQFETTRMLVAIEFFFVVAIKFLSMRRCNRRLWPSESQQQPSDSHCESTRRQTPRRFLSASLTACGLALPPVDRIT